VDELLTPFAQLLKPELGVAAQASSLWKEFRRRDVVIDHGFFARLLQQP